MAIEVIEVQVAGPQGPPGPQGPVGPEGVSVSSADLTMANFVHKNDKYLPIIASGGHGTTYTISTNLPNSTQTSTATVIEAMSDTVVDTVGYTVTTPMDTGGKLVGAVYRVEDFSRVFILPDMPVDSSGFKEIEFAPQALQRGKYLVIVVVDAVIGTTNPTFWSISGGMGLAVGVNMTSNNTGEVARWSASVLKSYPDFLPNPGEASAASASVTVMRISLKVSVA